MIASPSQEYISIHLMITSPSYDYISSLLHLQFMITFPSYDYIFIYDYTSIYDYIFILWLHFPLMITSSSYDDIPILWLHFHLMITSPSYYISILWLFILHLHLISHLFLMITSPAYDYISIFWLHLHLMITSFSDASSSYMRQGIFITESNIYLLLENCSWPLVGLKSSAKVTTKGQHFALKEHFSITDVTDLVWLYTLFYVKISVWLGKIT